MKRVLSFVVAAMLAGQALAQIDFETVFEIDDLCYIVTDETNHYVTIVAAQTSTKVLNIQEKVTNPDSDDDVEYTVTSIGENVFYYCSSLTSVTIPNSVTSIGASAFASCSGLTTVTIGNSVASIGDGAFSNCSSLTTVTIPNSVTSIGSYAFEGCSSLTSVTIGNSVTSIGHGTFSNCSSLTSVTIPSSVTSIGASAFASCSGLTTVTIGNSVASIGEGAFSNCSGLTSVTIPSSVTSIGASTFSSCNKLTEINVESVNTNYASENGVLFNKDKTTIICFPVGKKETAYTIPSSVTSIGSSAFNGCSGLTTVTIGNSVASIGEDAFSNCSSLTSVTIPSSVTSIGASAFASCSGLISVTISGSIPSISNSAFSGCSGLTTVTISNSVTSIGSSAFNSCFSLTTIAIPNSVTSISDYAFFGCRLTSICYEGRNEPTYKSTSFEFVNKTIPVCVPEDYSSNSWCGFTNIIKGHNIVEDAEVAATCTETGITEGSHCSYCGKIIVAQEIIPASHTYGTSVTAPTCTEVGYTTHSCSVCSHTFNSDTVAATGHTEITDEAVAATCTTAGKTAGKHCSVCNAALEGLETIPALGHTEATDAAIAATCTAAGKTEGKHCSVCNAVLVAQQEVEALGHKFEKYTYNNDATTAADGTETAVCERGCGTTDTRVAEGTKLQEPEKGTAVTDAAASTLSIYTRNNVIVVENAPDEICVYDAMGRLICRDATPCVRNELKVNTPGIYIVKIGGTAKRVMIND